MRSDGFLTNAYKSLSNLSTLIMKEHIHKISLYRRDLFCSNRVKIIISARSRLVKLSEVCSDALSDGLLIDFIYIRINKYGTMLEELMIQKQNCMQGVPMLRLKWSP